MKKYFRGIIFILYSLIRFSSMKVFHFKSIKFHTINMISPFTKIELGKKSLLILSKMVNIKSGVKILVRDSAVVSIGEGTFLNYGCMVVSHEKITVGNNVQCGPNVFIYDHDHDFRSENGLKNLKYKTKPVSIGNNVWIGASAVILRGTIIGNNCVIGAGTIVKGEYPDNSIIMEDRKIKEIIYSYNN